MKKIIVLFSVLSLVLTSCSNDDVVGFTSEDLIGKWECTSVDYDGTATVTVNGETSKITITGEDINNSMISTFNESNKVLFTQGTFTIELRMTVGGVERTSYSNLQQILDGDSWNQNGRTLRIYKGDEEERYEIDELLPTSMILSSSHKEDVLINGQAATVDFDLVATYRSIN
ncbi:hypothetical protein Q4566_14855 [Tamlana sp. 2_MG-2023]|uniref:hypothetical protein n=1 Tax=unclassified Tamlana TaxID=2614803 RepID=UPI0026E2BF31|nr:MULTISPECIES: hypothetical protein [unclassified Tamlana]MDO6761489.1 hypothetical protein [Tamlana sp. 2_MG-2023]MDO6792336.1 hypothetical protein [Tamlana sp. 1_MG-2023]